MVSERRPLKSGTLVNLHIMLLVDKICLSKICLFFSGSKSFKKKFKGKGDDIKLRVKPKTFSKDVRGDNSPGQKRKAHDVDDHGKKKFKAKNWKDEQGRQDGRKGRSKQEKEIEKSDKDFSKNDKDAQHRTKQEQFNSRKRKLGEGGGSKVFIKKGKYSDAGEQNKGKN